MNNKELILAIVNEITEEARPFIALLCRRMEIDIRAKERALQVKHEQQEKQIMEAKDLFTEKETISVTVPRVDDSLQSRVSKSPDNQRKRWRAADIQRLQKHIEKGMTDSQIAKEMGRTEWAIVKVRRKLKAKK